MKRSKKFITGANAFVVAAAIIGILILLNIISKKIFTQADLTQNNIYTLSDVSIKAVRDLNDLEVQVFISKELPDSISTGFGITKNPRLIARAFTDKLQQYQSFSDGRMRLIFVRDDIEEKAERAKLNFFTGKEAEVEKGKLEFKKYCIGATFHYKDQMEVFPLAMEPEYYEFEITKILLRLKEKYEKSLVMEDVLKAGSDLVKSASSCMERIKTKKEDEEEGGLSSLFKGKEQIQKLVGAIRLNLDDIRKDCGKFNEALLSAKKLAGKNENLDLLLESAQKFGDMLSEFLSSIAEADEQGERKILAIKEKLAELHSLVERDGDSLKDAPGKKVIGFSCGYREFCPFHDLQPLIRPEIAGLLGQKNMFVQQFVNQAKQIEDQINSINMQIEKGLFTRRGFNVRRVDLEEGIPDDVSALVLYGPQEAYSERALYEIDQFLLSGKSVILFVNNYDVSVYNLRMSEDFQEGTFDLMKIESYPTNIEQLIEHYGVKINKNLVMEKKNFGFINIIQVQRQGQFNIQSQREFPYPLLPVFSDFSKESVLTRNLVSVTLPYASSLTILDKVKANQEVEAHELIKSSPESLVSSGEFELVPPALLRQVATKESNGPHTVAALLKGKFTSYFKGKEIPKRPEKKESDDPMERIKPKIPERAFKETGNGRLLVIGSNLGLESLTTEKVFDGFEMSQLTSGQADFFLKLRDYIARFQNWQLRLSQVGDVLQDNLDFLYNVLDWAVQQDALVEIRSKGVLKRPIANLSETAQSLVSYGYIFGLPFIFVIFGLLSYVSKKARRKKAFAGTALSK